MKTQFNDLVKIKKQELQNQEIQIAAINSQIARKFDEISQCHEQIRAFLEPKNGTIQDFKILQEYRQAYLIQIDSIHLEISELKKQKRELQELYKIASIEYEKVKFLQQNELKKKIALLKQKEEKNLDEIASIRYFFQRNENEN